MDEDGKLVNDKGDAIGASLAVTGARSQGKALALVGSVDWIQVRSRSSLVIVASVAFVFHGVAYGGDRGAGNY